MAIDHGMALGPMTGIEQPRRVFQALEPHVDAWMMTKGLYTHVYEPSGRAGIILRASGGATIVGPDITNESVTSFVEELPSLSADAVACSAFIGSPNERATLTQMSRVAEACRRWGVPLVGVIGVRHDKEKTRVPRFIALGARVAVEHGADIVKTYYTPDDFAKITRGCPAPILIAGGPKCETDDDTLRMIRGALDSGACGLVMGRNICQSERPIQLIGAARALIHEDASVEKAIALL